ncbi:DUF2238 domain-containing protein [Idiomarina sp. UBA3162]|uniref:DUF2238 domain-containing protein n=1 Tax=Idiomarina sp. UBA3162 TaxID=1946641 RepID=UPI000C89AD34|nr:DUF2238 domain-containing protein [Idiomarina sp. UBA3162]MAD52753.1 hypothetical protein [Idiomarinaceae bacterium]|tara:strand:+ start:720 stop:1337 length:618 start_codon:yes stop_codon:yes gene_type:complete
MHKLVWVLIFTSCLIWSAYHPNDPMTWWLEVLPALLGALLLAVTYRRFTFTRLVYGLALVHCVILMIGGHYTYAEVPFFDTLGDYFGWQRNNYDKLGHFAQGFVPAMIVREFVVRNHLIFGRLWQFVFITSFCLAFSAFYELIEWWVAVATGEGAEAFLGTQGYAWDTQSDMAFALIGATSALLLLSGIHNRQIEQKRSLYGRTQ